MSHGEYVPGKATESVVGYCVKCRAKRVITAPQLLTLSTGRPAKRGHCSHCNENGLKTMIYVIVKKN